MKRKSLVALCLGLIGLGFWACNSGNEKATSTAAEATAKVDTPVFQAPDTSKIPHNPFGEMVRYGRDLIQNTAYYIGPNGTVTHSLGNKMNCTNCHLDCGTRPYGWNYFSAHARYPQYRSRENRILSLGERINNCIERPLNGIPLPLGSKEIIAMECYIMWLGNGVPVGGHVKGDESLEIEYPNRAADPEKGKEIFMQNCASCHGQNGEGQMKPEGPTYIYPPLWGMQSYQKGSSPHRVIKDARFIKANMPYNIAKWNKPFLTDEQCVDVAAFINDDRIHPRPEKKDHKDHPDYPNIKTKPVDYGTGPFLDTFSEFQHKFGPYQPIIDFRKANNQPIIF